MPFVECPECGGRGYSGEACTCHCGHEHDSEEACDVCDGYGQIDVDDSEEESEAD